MISACKLGSNSIGAEAMIGVFPDEGFTAKASVGAGLFGGGFVFRIKPKQ